MRSLPQLTVQLAASTSMSVLLSHTKSLHDMWRIHNTRSCMRPAHAVCSSVLATEVRGDTAGLCRRCRVPVLRCGGNADRHRVQARAQETVRRSPAGAPSVPTPKRRRTSHADMHADALGNAPSPQHGRPAGVPMPVATAAAATPPPRVAIPGIVAPGPASSRSAHAQGGGAVASVTSPWPVLPYLENVEYAIAHAESQPLTFHRSVSRPLADFLSAVMNFLGVQVQPPLSAGLPLCCLLYG